MTAPDLGYQLLWADYSGYVEGRHRLLKRGAKRAPLPTQHTETFRTKDEAERRQAALQATGGDGFVSAVTAVTAITVPAAKPLPPLLGDLPPMAKRLTK